LPSNSGPIYLTRISCFPEAVNAVTHQAALPQSANNHQLRSVTPTLGENPAADESKQRIILARVPPFTGIILGLQEASETGL